MLVGCTCVIAHMGRLAAYTVGSVAWIQVLRPGSKYSEPAKPPCPISHLMPATLRIQSPDQPHYVKQADLELTLGDASASASQLV